MNLPCSNFPRKNCRRDIAMSLIELIGVLAVTAALAGVLIPVSLRMLDRIASEKEAGALAGFAESFRGGILRSRQITNSGNWADLIASENGMALGSVTNNFRHLQRAFLFDKGGWLNANLPYIQTNGMGLSSAPTNARVMFVSSLGASLPASLNNAAMTASDFDDLWNTADHTLPSTGVWSGWPGRADDVKIQRINLSPDFVKVVLGTYTGTNMGLYKIDDRGFFSTTNGSGFAGYFLKGTVLDLYSSAPAVALQHSEILDHDISFVYENGIWRSSILGAEDNIIGNSSGVVESFLQAAENMNAANTNGSGIQQYIVVTNFIAYMSNYNVWADSGFPKDALQTRLVSLQATMMDSVQGLFINSGGANNHFPSNNFTPCP